MAKTLHPLLKVVYAFLDTILEAGDAGAPAGPMYAAWMQHGGTLDQFEGIMQALIDSGKVRKSNNCYFAIATAVIEANGHIDIFYREAEEFVKAGWYWINYTNPKRQLIYEGGPFATRLEAELDLAEYLRK